MKIIKFTALWCADCIVMRPMWDEVKARFPEVAIEEHDFDDQPDLAASFGVSRVPYTIFFSADGQELARLDGMQSRQELLSQIERLLLEKTNYEKD